MSEDKVGVGPLAGIKVIEVSQYIAGPFAGQQLADAGADVIKVERPQGGDPLRNYASGKAPLYGPNFCAFNRNKRSVVLDLQSPEGAEAFRALAEKADVVLENFRPDVMDRLGIGYEALRKNNPKLIYCSIAGFASDGPNRRRPAFDSVGQALSGLLYLMTDPEKPMMRGPTLVDQVTGLYASNAILTALVEQARTGVGRRIDLTMMDASMAFIADALAFYTDSNIEWHSETRSAISHSLVLRCANDELLAVHLGGPERLWTAFAQVIGWEGLASDPRYNPRVVRVQNWSALLEELRPIFAARTRAEWMRLMIEADVPAAEVLRIPEVVEDEAVKHAEIFEVGEHPVAGPIKMIRRPARFDGQRGAPQRPPALLGEHTEEVLAEIGFEAGKRA